MIRAELLTPPYEDQDLDDLEKEPSPLAEVIQAWKAHLEDEG